MKHTHAMSAKLTEISEDIFFGYNASKNLSEGGDLEVKPLVQIGNIVDGYLQPTSACKKVPFHITNTTSRYLLKAGDVLVSARGSLMKCAVVEQEHEDAIASANFAVIRLRDKELIPRLLWSYLSSNRIQEMMHQKSSGTAQPSLNLREFREIEITIPDHSLQKILVEMITAAENQYKYATEAAFLRRQEALDLSNKVLEKP